MKILVNSAIALPVGNSMAYQYLAGLIDGEGSIVVSHNRTRKDGYARPNLRLTLGNTYKPIIDWLQKNFGGSVVTEKVKGNRKPSWQWVVSGSRASNILELVYPHLKIKFKQAGIGMTLVHSTYKINLVKYPELISFAQSLEEECHNLNRRGCE